MARASRNRCPLGVLMIDMDGLKQINDSHGHRIGDAVIMEFSNRLKKATRHADTAARLGGDEFGVILTSIDNTDCIDTAMQRIDTELNPPFIFEDQQYRIKASIGSALIPIDGSEPDQVLEVADHRMYAMKQANKTRVAALPSM